MTNVKNWEMNDNAPMSLYGFAEASTDFDRRHPQWSAVMSRLWDAMNLAFSRTQAKRRLRKFLRTIKNRFDMSANS